MKTVLIGICLSFFSLSLFAEDALAPEGVEPIAPVAEPQINSETPPATKASPAKRDVARKRKHAKKRKHRRHHSRK